MKEKIKFEKESEEKSVFKQTIEELIGRTVEIFTFLFGLGLIILGVLAMIFIPFVVITLTKTINIVTVLCVIIGFLISEFVCLMVVCGGGMMIKSLNEREFKWFDWNW